MIRENKLKKLLAEGQVAVGTFIKSTDLAITELICLNKFDFIIIDNEHTSMNKETMVNIIRTAEIYDVTPIVRVRTCDQSQILQALDAGAMGVQVPNIDTKEEVEHVVKSTKYGPAGYRGFAASQRCAGYGFMNPAEYAWLNNENVMNICYCETKKSFENLDKILQVEGLDIVFIGPSDLSQAFGVTGDVRHPTVTGVVDTIIEKTVKAGKICGTIAANGLEANALIEKGVRFIVMSSDFGMVNASAKMFLGQIKR